MIPARASIGAVRTAHATEPPSFVRSGRSMLRPYQRHLVHSAFRTSDMRPPTADAMRTAPGAIR